MPEAEEVLDLYFPVLDKGYVALVQYMGSDVDIESAARVSYGKGTRKVSDTRNLIRRLVRDSHSSPIEMCSLKFHIKAPLYVIQQFLRHRTAKVNQESFRYTEIQDEFQMTQPSEWRLQSKDNKQGSSGTLNERSDDEDVWSGEELSHMEFWHLKDSKTVYDKRINAGIAREQARKEIPVSTYSSFYWKMDLRNLFNFLSLRTHHHAQLEIRQYANVIAGLTKRVAPICYEAWLDYQYCARNFSRLDLLFLSYLSSPDIYGQFEMGEWQSCYETDEGKYHKELGFSKSEYIDFWSKLNPIKVPNFDLDLSKGVRKE